MFRNWLEFVRLTMHAMPGNWMHEKKMPPPIPWFAMLSANLVETATAVLFSIMVPVNMIVFTSSKYIAPPYCALLLLKLE